MLKHTPGPWNINCAPNGHVYVQAKHNAEIARMGSENMLADNSSAACNALLISAAPELLEALRDAVSTQPADSPIKWVIRARVAIAKATGA